MDDFLMHVGVKRRSGRYAWGSGENPYQHEPWYDNYMSLRAKGLSDDDIRRGMGYTKKEFEERIAIGKSQKFLHEYRRLKKDGLGDTAIAEKMNYSSTEFRALRSKASAEEYAYNQQVAMKMKEHGYANQYIADRLGVTEGTIRNYLNPLTEGKGDKAFKTAELLRDQIKEKGAIDVGAGVNRELNVTDTTLKTALTMLKDEGYNVSWVRVEQNTNPGKFTTVKVLSRNDISYPELYKDVSLIKPVNAYISNDTGEITTIHYPDSIDRSRVKVRYFEDGGSEKDGLIEIKRGVSDLSLGGSNYAQVRIGVDNKYFMKGMCMYADDSKFPPGIDVIYNSNKHVGSEDSKVFKEYKASPADPNNPFGASIKRQSGAINICSEEGDWGEWSKTLASQMLSKQSTGLIKRQLNLSYSEKKDEFDEIMALTEPSIRKKLLKSFADDCDSAAVHLKAAALPRQATQVLLPLETISDKEIYAPNFRNGEEVVLIRYPHGGIFEIPRLKVNNNLPEGKKSLGQTRDAVGISPETASVLSGADFDGDTALVIPVNDKVKVQNREPFEGLKNFSTTESYPGYPGMKSKPWEKGSDAEQREMGKITNLITDMTIQGATDDEIERAVRHSMVIIDTGKHKLDFERSYEDNRIQELKDKYQKGGGASTLLSLAKNPVYVPRTKQPNDRDIDPATGKIIPRHDQNADYIDKNGNPQTRTMKVTKMSITDDARSLSSGTQKEEYYADYANKLKALANTARKEYLAVVKTPRNSEAAAKYANEVADLKAQLNIALKNAPRERQAQLITTSLMETYKKKNPDIGKKEVSKQAARVLAATRARVGAKKTPVVISDNQWAAIIEGAVSPSLLDSILDNTDLDAVKVRATPRNTLELSAGKIARIKSMIKSGFSQSEIADTLGISTTTVNKYIKEGA